MTCRDRISTLCGIMLANHPCISSRVVLHPSSSHLTIRSYSQASSHADGLISDWLDALDVLLLLRMVLHSTRMTVNNTTFDSGKHETYNIIFTLQQNLISLTTSNHNTSAGTQLSGHGLESVECFIFIHFACYLTCLFHCRLDASTLGVFVAQADRGRIRGFG